MSQPTPQPSSSKPWIAALASAIVPGTGQFIAGNGRRGRNLLIIDVAILAILLFVFREGKVSVLTAWIQPTSLALMMVGNILLLGYRVWAADDAYRIAKGRDAARLNSSTAAVLGGAVGLTLILLVPHVVFGYYDLVQYDLITSVFGDNVTAAPSQTTSTTGPPTTDASGATVTTDPSDTTSSTAHLLRQIRRV